MVYMKYYRMLFSHKKKRGMNLENTTVRNRKTPDRKGHVLFNSIYVKYPK